MRKVAMHRAAPVAMASFLLCLAGCALVGGGRPEPAAPSIDDAAPKGWREIASPADERRIGRWRNAWTMALAHARSAGFGDAIAREGRLLEPDAALSGPAPPPGDYGCRVIKLGAQGEGGLGFIAYPAFRCRILSGGERAGFVKLDGSQRPQGQLYAHDDARLIFLGTMVLGDERRALEYGRDPDRDMIGAVERVDRARWRLVLPFPRWESQLDVIELVPARPS